MAATASTLDRETRHRATVRCFHCGTPCPGDRFSRHEKSFCCQGCLTVFEMLSENGLGNFYHLADTAGVRVKVPRADGESFAVEQTIVVGG